MATTYQIYRRFASVAIDRLMERGYLLDNLDWDMFNGKYTLRIRADNRSPMVAVGLITFRKKDSMIVLINAVTGKREEFQISTEGDSSNKEDFLDFMCEYAQKLREEAAYK